MTIVTAIVSLKARPKDIKMPANKPDFAWGKITYLVTSNGVAPSENAASFKSCGTIAITSLPIDAENGIIMIAKIMAAVKIPTP